VLSNSSGTSSVGTSLLRLNELEIQSQYSLSVRDGLSSSKCKNWSISARGGKFVTCRICMLDRQAANLPPRCKCSERIDHKGNLPL
jgi:hypothetical protein